MLYLLRVKEFVKSTTYKFTLLNLAFSQPWYQLSRLFCFLFNQLTVVKQWTKQKWAAESHFISHYCHLTKNIHITYPQSLMLGQTNCFPLDTFYLRSTIWMWPRMKHNLLEQKKWTSPEEEIATYYNLRQLNCLQGKIIPTGPTVIQIIKETPSICS